MLSEKAAPRIVQQKAVSLKGIQDGFALRELLLQSNGALKKRDAGQGGFAALPGKNHLIRFLGGDMLLDKLPQDFIIHTTRVSFRVKPGFLQIKAVIAAEVT